MATDLARYILLLSSPGDAAPFCEVADRAIQSLNRSLSDATGVELYSTDWRRDSRADSGAEPQALLNRQIVDDADIVLPSFIEGSAALRGSTDRVPRRRYVSDCSKRRRFFSISGSHQKAMSLPSPINLHPSSD